MSSKTSNSKSYSHSHSSTKPEPPAAATGDDFLTNWNTRFHIEKDTKQSLRDEINLAKIEELEAKESSAKEAAEALKLNSKLDKVYTDLKNNLGGISQKKGFLVFVETSQAQSIEQCNKLSDELHLLFDNSRHTKKRVAGLIDAVVGVTDAYFSAKTELLGMKDKITDVDAKIFECDLEKKAVESTNTLKLAVEAYDVANAATMKQQVTAADMDNRKAALAAGIDKATKDASGAKMGLKSNISTHALELEMLEEKKAKLTAEIAKENEEMREVSATNAVYTNLAMSNQAESDFVDSFEAAIKTKETEIEANHESIELNGNALVKQQEKMDAMQQARNEAHGSMDFNLKSQTTDNNSIELLASSAAEIKELTALRGTQSMKSVYGAKKVENLDTQIEFYSAGEAGDLVDSEARAVETRQLTKEVKGLDAEIKALRVEGDEEGAFDVSALTFIVDDLTKDNGNKKVDMDTSDGDEEEEAGELEIDEKLSSRLVEFKEEWRLYLAAAEAVREAEEVEGGAKAAQEKVKKKLEANEKEKEKVKKEKEKEKEEVKKEKKGVRVVLKGVKGRGKEKVLQ